MFFEQLNFTGNEAISNNIKLNFNHPMKELVWCTQKERFKNPREYVNFIYYKNFDDYRFKLYGRSYYTDTDIRHLREYSNINCDIKFKEIIDGLIYENENENENKLYTDVELFNIVRNMKYDEELLRYLKNRT